MLLSLLRKLAPDSALLGDLPLDALLRSGLVVEVPGDVGGDVAVLRVRGRLITGSNKVGLVEDAQPARRGGGAS